MEIWEAHFTLTQLTLDRHHRTHPVTNPSTPSYHDEFYRSLQLYRAYAVMSSFGFAQDKL
jgi:hypothetical protein